MLNGIGWGDVLSGTEVTAVTSDENPVDALIVVAISPRLTRWLPAWFLTGKNYSACSSLKTR